jgi:tetratricopeptide (TPR) repeat protein
MRLLLCLMTLTFLVDVKMGAHRQALDYLNQSLLLFRSIKDAGGEANRLSDIGVVYNTLGAPQEALKNYQQTLPMLRAAGDRSGEASTLNNIGSAFRVMGEPQQALAYFKQALSAQREIGDAREMAITLTNIGALHYRLGDAQQTLDYYDQALPLRRKVGAIAGQAITLTSIGLAHLSLGDPQRAVEYLKQSLSLTAGGQSRSEEAQALTIWRAIGERQSEASALIRMGGIYREQGDPRLALKRLEEALILARDIGETGTEAIAIAEIARVERDLGDLDQALNRIETALDLVESLRARIRIEDLRVSFLASKHSNYEFYIDLLMRLHERRPSAGYDALAFEASERARGRNLLDVIGATRAGIRQGADPQSLERQRSLQGQINAKDRLRIQLAARNQMEKSAEIEKELRALLAEYQEAREQMLIRSPRYATLTDPVPLKLKEIQRQSLLATMRREMSARRRAERTVAVFSDPVFQPDDPRVKQASPGAEKASGDKTESDLVRSARETGLRSFERLIHTRKEAEAIVALAPPEQGFKALDFAASRATVLNAGLDQYRIVHFATHGLLNSQRPELSGIVLSLVDEAGRAQEGFLRVYEIYNLKLNAELVVLSACSTALGKSSPAAALREAQISMWREPRWAALYYWAGLALQGDWN